MNTNELGTKLYEGDVKELFLNASTKLYNSVVHTLGPNGLNSAIPTSNQYLSIINDGKTILETLSSNDIAEKLAINTLKESAFATNKNAGDGTTTTIVMQHELLKNILKQNENVENQIITSDYLLKIRDKLLAALQDYKKDLASDDDLKNIITVSLGSDKFTDIVFNAFSDLSLSQKPTLVKVNTKSTTDYVKINGVNLAPVEVNPVVLKSISLSGDEPLDIIILNQEVSRIDNAFAALLSKISKSNKKTILLYTDIKPSVMDQLLYNIQEGALNLIPVRLAMPITQLDEIISNLEEYFNCKALSDMLPYQTNYNNSGIIGNGIGYILNKDSVIIKNDNDKYNDEDHLIPSSSSAIEIGFITFSQQDEDYRRLEDAVQSAYNARNYGYLLGAGYTYYSLSDLISDGNEINDAIEDALDSIFNRLKPAETDYTDFINYIKYNVFDSYKVIEQVILNSFTVVAQILSTNCILVPYQRNRITGNIE